MSGRSRGAGRGGGLLFVALLVFLAYLAATALAGLLRLAAVGALGLAVVLLAVAVSRRR